MQTKNHPEIWHIPKFGTFLSQSLFCANRLFIVSTPPAGPRPLNFYVLGEPHPFFKMCQILGYPRIRCFFNPEIWDVPIFDVWYTFYFLYQRSIYGTIQKQILFCAKNHSGSQNLAHPRNMYVFIPKYGMCRILV